MAVQHIIPTLLGVLFLLLAGAWRLIRRAGGRRPAGLRTAASQMAWIVAALLFLMAIGADVWIGLNRVEQQTRKGVGEMLRVVARTTQGVVHTWINGEKNHVEQFARQPAMTTAVEALLRTPRTREHLSTSPALVKLRQYFQDLGEAHVHEGFSVIAPDFTTIGAMRDDTLGRQSLIGQYQPDRLKRAFSGLTIFIPPVFSDGPMADRAGRRGAAWPLLFIASPMRDRNGTVIAVVAFRYDAGDAFTRICRISRPGRTGETYFFDRTGRLLSQSRFSVDLLRAGLLSRHESSLGLALRDPGGNLLLGYRPGIAREAEPLTHLVAAAVSGRSGMDVTGYRDYRGIRVLGAWYWDPALQMGIATEIDEQEALAGYRGNRRVVLGVLALVGLLTTALVLFLVLSGKRASRALRRARDEWERVARERNKRLAQSEKRFRTIFESSNDAIILLTHEGFFDCNARALEMFGFDTLAAFTAAHLADVSPPRQPDGQDSQAAAQARIETALREGYCRFEWVHRRANGEDFPTEVLLSAFRFGDKTVLESTVRDITQRKKAEEELQKLSQAVEQSPSTVLITDTRGEIQYVNPRFSELTGFSAAEVIGRNPNILNSGTHPPAFYKELWATISAGAVWNGELCNLKKNGERYWESAAIAPIKNALGRITHYVAMKEDITARKRVEAQLKEAKEAAEAATRAKSDFLANMSHEIRTPMNVILGFLELVLEDAALPQRWRRHLAKAQISASALLGLINDILDVSKLESGKFSIEARPFHLRRLMAEVHETLAVKAREKGLDLLLEMDPSIGEALVGDPLRIRQILFNLIENAVKFTERGRVALSVTPGDRPGRYHFAVEDTGIGIPASRLGQIFEPFTQADASMTRRFGGTGLGTTISRELVELMGGAIWVESEEGRGSTFHFTLELASTDQAPEHTDVFVVPGKPVAPIKRHGFRILVVEDMEANVELAKIRLERQGHTVSVACDGREAVSRFQQHPYDVILMDIQMPRMSGTEATARIRALEAGTGRHVPIIAMTAGVSKDEMKRDYEAGVDAIVAKPIDFGKLFRMIDSVVPEGTGRKAAADTRGQDSPAGSVLPVFEGLDTKTGIDRWQDTAVYVRALNGFARDNGRAAAELTHLIEEGGLARAARFIHRLKGVTGNLAMPEVSHLLARMEAHLRDRRMEALKDRLRDLGPALERVMAAISRLDTPPEADAIPKKEMDSSSLKTVFMNMLETFDQFNPAAIQPFVSELKASLSSEQVQLIESHLERYDLDLARQEALALAQTLNLDLEKMYGERQMESTGGGR